MNRTENPAPLLTAHEVAAVLRITPRTAYKYLQPGGCLERLRVDVGGKGVRVRADDLNAWLAGGGTLCN